VGLARDIILRRAYAGASVYSRSDNHISRGTARKSKANTRRNSRPKVTKDDGGYTS